METALIYFGLYLAIVLGIGVISSRRETEEGFMLAERQVGGIQLAATMTAGFFDSAVLALYIGYLYEFGFSAIWIFVGILLGFVVVRRYAARIREKAHELGAYSMPEYFYRFLGKRNGLTFSAVLVVQFLIFLIINFVVAGKILSMLFPVSYVTAVLIGSIIILAYLLLAGFKAVIRTDFFQLLITVVLVLASAFFLFGKTTIPATELNLVGMGFGNIIGFVVLGAVSVMVAPDLWQRFFAAKDGKTAERGLWYAGVAIVLLALVTAVVGLVTKQFYPNIAPQDALVAGFSTLLPLGMKAFGMVLLYAVALSSSDTVIFVLSSIFTRDLQNYTRTFSQKSMRMLTRTFMLIVVAVAAIVALTYQDIVTFGLSFGSLNLALFPAVFGTLYWKLKEPAVFWSLVLALLSLVGLLVTNQLNPETAALVLPVALFSLLAFQKWLPDHKAV